MISAGNKWFSLDKGAALTKTAIYQPIHCRLGENQLPRLRLGAIVLLPTASSPWRPFQHHQLR
jgi:hypothetical protein